MTQDARSLNICTRFSIMIRSLVADRESVNVFPGSTSGGHPIIVVRVTKADLQDVLGRGNRVASALRVLLDSIGEQQKVGYLLDINGLVLCPENTPGFLCKQVGGSEYSEVALTHGSTAAAGPCAVPQ